jgi:hypothetical protein
LEDKSKIQLQDYYKPPKETAEFLYDVYGKYMQWRTLKEQPYKQFNSQTWASWLNESRQKFWGYIPLSFDTDTPQFFFPETRNQIIAILAKIANLRLKPVFGGVEGLDLVVATVLKDLFAHWRKKVTRKMSDFWQYLYCIINGTVIVFTAYNSNVRQVKNITKHNPETGETTYTKMELDDSDVEEVIVNIEDFFFPKMWEPDIQKQNECIWRTLMRIDDFKDEYHGYANVDMVFPGSQFSDSSIFADFLSYDVKGGEFVEVIKYFNKVKDQYAIIANGVLLNPLKGEKSVEEITPLPWNHKALPFSKTIWEPIDATFFPGMSLAMKVKSPQDALNKMWELLLDREQRSVAAPIITTDPSIEFGLDFKAGRIYQVQADVNQYKELAVAPASSSYWNALTALQGIIQKTGGGGSGIALPSRQPRSATEQAANATQQKEMTGLYYLFYEHLLEQKTWLAINNFIQFYTSGETKKILGDRKFNKIIALTDTQLSGGGLGNRELRITEKPVPGEELRKESYLRSLFRKERVEIIEATPKALREIQFDIKIDFEPENSPQSERLIYLDYLRTIWGLFGQSGLISMKKSLFRVAEKFGENISDLVEENVLSEYEKERFGFTTVAEQPQAPAPAIEGQKQQTRGQMFGALGPGSRMMQQGISEENMMMQ